MIAVSGRSKSIVAGRTRAAVRGDPVAKCRLRSNEATAGTGFLGLLLLPDAGDKMAHQGSPLGVPRWPTVLLAGPDNAVNPGDFRELKAVVGVRRVQATQLDTPG